MIFLFLLVNVFNDIDDYFFVGVTDESATDHDEAKICESVTNEDVEDERSITVNDEQCLSWEADEQETSVSQPLEKEDEYRNAGNEATCISEYPIKNEEDCGMGKCEDDGTYQAVQSETASDVNKSIVSKLFVHSQWLSVQSSYFKALFYSGLKETYSREVVMKIYEHERQAHLTLIQAMYKPDVLNDKDYELSVQVLVLAHKYDVRLLVKKCKYVLLSITPSLRMCEYILQEIKHLPDTADIYEMLEKFLIKKFKPIDKTWTTDKFTDLSEPALRLLLGSDHLPTISENTVFVALMKWVDLNLSWSALRRSDLLNVLRFEFMSVDFLYDVVQHHYTAKQMPRFNKYLLNGLAYHGFSYLRREQLEPQPKKRPLVNDSGPTFSWIIDNKLEKNLTESPGKRFYSDIFWYQGYKMQLYLAYRDESNCSFFFTVWDLRSKASLHASYKAQSNLFASRTLQPGKNKYTSKSSSWGYETLKRNTMLRGEGFTIDVWVTVH